MDFEQTYPNSLTSTVPTSVKLPMVLENDKEAIQAAIKTCNIADKNAVRLVRMKNTLSVGQIFVSESLMEEVGKNTYLEAEGDATALDYDEHRNLI